MKTNIIILPNSALVDVLKSISPFKYRMNGGNIGDMVIAFSEQQLFDAINAKHDVLTAGNKLSHISKPFNLVYGGGGAWIDLYQANSKKQIETYFKNKNLKQCIILPSTFYKCDEVIKSFDSRFIVFCRDARSYDYCKSLNASCKFFLHNDLAFSADFSSFNLDNLSEIGDGMANKIRVIHDYRLKNLTKTANFLRNDNEKTNAKVNDIINLDISRLGCSYGEKMPMIDIKPYVRLFLYAIDKYDTIITNRLHVAICAYKLGKSILLYDNSYGKVFNTIRYSLPNCSKIEFKGS